MWVSCAERWAQAFRKQQVLNIVTTNNGVEAQNKHFKYNYLQRPVGKSAYGIAVLLVESKLSGSYRTYNVDIPPSLHNCPSHFIKYCMKSRFSVRSSADVTVNYSVQLQTPSCTCEAWLRTHFPCKHFYAVIDEWDFSSLPRAYLNNAFITLDCEEVDSTPRIKYMSSTVKRSVTKVMACSTKVTI